METQIKPRNGRRYLAEGMLSASAVMLVFSLCYMSLGSVSRSVIISGVSALILIILGPVLHSRMMPLFAAAALVLVMLYSVFCMSPVLSLDGKTGTFVLQCRQCVTSGYGNETVDCILLGVNGKRVNNAKATLVLSDISHETFMSGDRVTVTGKISVSRGRGKLSRGCMINLIQSGELRTETSAQDSILCMAERFSYRVANYIRSIFPEKEASLLCALLCGDKSGFSSADKSMYSRAGVSHITAVSGMHMSVIIMLFTLILPKKAAVCLSVAGSLAFAAFAGFSPSVIRALIMSGIASAAFLLNRDYDRLTALLCAAVVIAARCPFYLLNLSFILSFSGTLGIILFSQPLLKWLTRGRQPKRIFERIIYSAASAVSVTLAAQVFTFPVSLYFFPCVSLVSALSNLLIGWAVAPAMLAGAAGTALCYLIPAAEEIIVGFASLPLKYINYISGLLGGRFSAVVSANDPYVVFAALFIAAICLLLYFRIICPKVFIAAFCTACLLSSVFSLSESGPRISIWGENGLCSISVGGRDKALLINAPAAYGGRIFAENFCAASGKADIILTKSSYSLFGGIAPEMCADIYSPESISGMNTLICTQDGVLRSSDYAAELLHADSGALAVRIVARRISVLDISALSPYDTLPAIPQTDILVINSDFAETPAVLSAVCASLRPSAVLVTGRSDMSIKELERLCSCTAIRLDDAGTVNIR